VRHVLALHAAILLPPDPTQLTRDQWYRVEGDAQAFDLVEMKIATAHVGLFVSSIDVLHCERGTGTVCVPVWRLRRPPLGIWRHETLLI